MRVLSSAPTLLFFTTALVSAQDPAAAALAAAMPAAAMPALAMPAPAPLVPIGCAAQNVLNNCLNNQGLMLGACAYSDWACKCEAQKTIVSCFNTCPGDETRAAQEGQVKVFCNASKPASSSSSAAKKAKSSAVNKSSENADSAKPTASVEDSGKKVAKGKPLVTQNPTSGEDEVKAAKPKDVKGDDDGTVASGAAAVKASVAVLAVGCAALALF